MKDNIYPTDMETYAKEALQDQQKRMEEEARKLRLEIIRNKQEQRELIAKELIAKHKFKTVIGSKEDDLYTYNQGSYSKKGEGIIKQEVETILGQEATTNTVNEIINKIKRMTLIDRERLDVTPTNLICIQNGVLNTDTMQLTPHNHEVIFLNKISVTYKPGAQSPNIQKFLKEILYPEDIKVLQEYIGYCMYRRYAIKKAVIIVGEKDTGKTTLLNLITKFIGTNNISGESLQKIIYDRFSAITLYKKLLNIYDDLPFKDLNDAGGLKMATGGGYLTGERKFGDRFSFINHAKFIFSANKIPRIIDTDDDAYYDRWMIIPCNTQFGIDNAQRDALLIDKLTTPEELEGFLVWALEGLNRIMKDMRFSYTLTTEENKIMMQRSSDSMAAFVQDVLEQKEDGVISKEDMYQVYLGYARANKLSAITKHKLGLNLQSYATYVSTGQKVYNNRKGVHCWLGVYLKKGFENKLTGVTTLLQLMRDNDITPCIRVKNSCDSSDSKPLFPQETKVPKWDEKARQWNRCVTCTETPTNQGSDGKPYCQEHLQ